MYRKEDDNEIYRVGINQENYDPTSGRCPSIPNTVWINSLFSGAFFLDDSKNDVLSTFLICLPFNLISARASKSDSEISAS